MSRRRWVDFASLDWYVDASQIDAFSEDAARFGIGAVAVSMLIELGLECPEDLAFAFTCFEEASLLGVGAAWTAVRRDAKAFAHTACAQWRGCKPATGHGQSGKVTPTSRSGWMPR